MASISQKSFAGGVMSPMMAGRSDDKKFQTGLAACRNFIVLPQGPVQNRPGTTFVARCKYTTSRARLIPFTFSQDQTMILELGEKYIRFHTEGRTLMQEDGITPYEVQTPYSADEVLRIHFVQSADVVTLTHPAHPPMELRRYSALDWRLEGIVFGMKLPPPQNVRAEKASTAEQEINKDAYTFKYCVTALNADRTDQSSRSEVASVVANIYNNGTTVRVTWNAVEGASFYRVYRNEGGIYGLIGETEDTSIIDDNIAPDSDYTPPRYDDPFSQDKGIRSVTVTNGGSNYWVSGVKDLTFRKSSAIFHSYLAGSWVTGGIRWSSDMSPSVRPGFKARIEIYDKSGAGHGAVIEADLKATYELSYSSNSGDGSSDKEEGWFCFPSVYLTNVRVVTPGEGFVKPAARVVVYEGEPSVYLGGKKYSLQWAASKVSQDDCCDITLLPGIKLNVVDDTGYGAELVPICRDGKVVEVKVYSCGMKYTAPTVTVTGGYGSGATFSVEIGGAGDYPATATYFEQRRCFANSGNNPQAIWMTRSGTEDDMTYSIPVRDDDRIAFKIASRERHAVRHLVPLSRLIVLTEAGEWAVSSVNSDAITPSSIELKAQSFIGASWVQPAVVNSSMLYAASRGGHVRELAYQYNSGGYTTGDVSIRCAHLFDAEQIECISYAKSPWPIVWFVSSSGSLLGLTYVPDEGIGAWHEHTTDGSFESVACVAEGAADVAYCVVRREINGEPVRYIERLGERDFPSLSESIFVDCAGTYRGTPTTHITGLDWLEGKTVSVLADGAVMTQKIVKNGAVDLEAEASVVHVGLPIDAEVETLPLSVMLKDGNSIDGRKRNLTKVMMRVYQSSGIFVGQAGQQDGDLVEYRQRKTEQPGVPPDPVTDVITVGVKSQWTTSGAVRISQLNPLPLTILSVTTEFTLGG